MNRFLVIMIFFFPVSLFSADSKRTVDSVEFEGLKTITRNDIVFYGRIGVSGNRITVNEDALRNYLTNETLIKNFKLIDKNNTICIVVDECETKYGIFLENRSGNKLLVLDADFRTVSSERIVDDIPLVVIPEGNFMNGSPDDSLRENLLAMTEVGSRYAVWKQIQTIKMNFDSLKIRCYNRRTVFTIENSAVGFYKLNNIVAYLDRINFYPVRLDLEKNLTVIK